MMEVPRTAEDRLIEWARSLHREPWNYWPSVSVLGRIKDEGQGASQGTDSDKDGGMAAMIDRMADGIAKDRRCADVREACLVMPSKLLVIVDVTFRNCASGRDVPRDSSAAADMAGLSRATYFRRKREMLDWLAEELCIYAKMAA